MEDAPEFPAVTEALETAPPALTPIQGREAPAVWVKRLAIFQSWPPSDDTRLREIELRRGLNIVWARQVGKNADASRLAGHSAGKSTFCRLIRYVLDDATAGTDEFRKRFTVNFGVGWALAEVYVAGRRWLVGRPIADNAAGYHSFAYPDGTLTQEFPERPPRVGYKDYCTAIDEAVFGQMTIRTLPGSQKKLEWPQLVQWLTRDQEAHFHSLLDWRDSDSDSESNPISADDRSSLIRLTMGLVRQKEEPLLKKHAAKAGQHEAKIRERVKLEFAIERDRQALADAIKQPVGDPKDSVLQLEISNQVANLRNEADTAVKSAVQDDGNRPLLDAVARTQAEYEIARAIADEAKARVEMEDNRIKGITPPPKPATPVSPVREMLQGMKPFRGYCSATWHEARQAGCSLGTKNAPPDEVQEATKEIREAAPVSKDELERLQAEHQRHELVAADKKRAMDSAQSLFHAARVHQREELEKLREPGLRAAMIEAAHRSFAKACGDLETLNGEITALAVEKEEISDQLKGMTKLHKDLLAKFTHLFHHMGQHMLAKAVTGRVEFSGKSIEPRLIREGDRNSAALRVTKCVMFDLAALALGITTSEAHHPRFLLHDSPRESDMAPLMYGGLFYAAKELEGDLGENAPFQYIITTTEPPPEDLMKEPWLRLELDASVEKDRFLRVNL